MFCCQEFMILNPNSWCKCKRVLLVKEKGYYDHISMVPRVVLSASDGYHYVLMIRKTLCFACC